MKTRFLSTISCIAVATLSTFALGADDPLDEGTTITLNYLNGTILASKDCTFRTKYKSVPDEALTPCSGIDLCKKFEGTPKNIILIIGDGMGLGAQEFTSSWTTGRRDGLFMHHLPHGGMCFTQSANSSVTDSAASATALATGTKVKNSHLSQTSDEFGVDKLQTSAEIARDKGMKVALITSDYINGATPAAFYSHSHSRKETEKILAQIATCGFDIISGNTTTVDTFKNNSQIYDDITAAGYEFIKSSDSVIEAIRAGKKVVGHVSPEEFNDEACLSEILSATLDRFESAENGFFVMLESAAPDWGGHGGLPTFTINGTLLADWAVYRAVEFASKRDDTLVIVTADHETGGVYSAILRNGPRNPAVAYTTSSHTGVPVPVYAYGPGAEAFDGVIDNTLIGQKCIEYITTTSEN